MASPASRHSPGAGRLRARRAARAERSGALPARRRSKTKHRSRRVSDDASAPAPQNHDRCGRRVRGSLEDDRGPASRASAARKSPASSARSTIAARNTSSNTTTRSPPSSFARYIAMSASRSKLSTVSCSASTATMPTLAASRCSTPARRIGSLNASQMPSAMVSACADRDRNDARAPRTHRRRRARRDRRSASRRVAAATPPLRTHRPPDGRSGRSLL